MSGDPNQFQIITFKLLENQRDQLKSINTFQPSNDYTCIYYKTGSVLQEENVYIKKCVAFPFEQTQILFTQGCFLLSLVEILPVFL